MAFPVPLREVSTVSAEIFCNCNPRDHKSLTLCRKSGGFASWARGRVSVKSSGFTVSALNQNLRLHGQFSAPVKRGSRQSKEEEEKQDYYVNLGYAIRTLREDFPQLFYRELSFDIYRDDIVLRDPINTFAGIDNYKSIFWGLRFHGRIFFRALWVDIASVWQPAENIIMVRWTVHGIPRVPWESRGRFDGTSEYKLDRNGKIFEHKVDNIAVNSPPKFRVLAVEELIQSIGCPSTPRPTYFEISSSSLWRNDSD
ncbi:hypothetical protein HS088_TW17G00629 [Tripterygium wilfordii]|uniref:Uncharacterized protein n=1 Tax=Tripterygium wilfordii TaxID=458696 RepID=A0A7J7CGB3_TRIWF|nr:uncharacterized protein LOC119981747 [Tripterygium wilfordii]KAF5733093.1 hypothetical protein HS088_TW17G00629 [Tripterygium wilfordii]